MMNTIENTLTEIVEENERRNALLSQPYDPMTGLGACGSRTLCQVPGGERAYVPDAMIRRAPESLKGNIDTYRMTRIQYDFEYWCANCATIRDKVSGRDVKLTLNHAQRRMLAEMERQRLRDKGIRIILLKARQWGGSTLVMVYMAWIQIVLKRNWNSLICGHKKSSSVAIRGMYSKLLARYPKEFLPEDVTLRLRNYEGSSNAKVIEGRDCVVVMGSAYSEDVMRGFDISMAHLSEVAFWPKSNMHDPQDLMRSVDGSVLMAPMTMEVLESTANGVGSFFHTEWLKAVKGESDKTAIFVPWYEIEIYRQPVDDVQRLWESLDEYEQYLWQKGCTLEMINWYHEKRRAYQNHHKMKAEFPTTDLEAFALTGSPVFDGAALSLMRTTCREPMMKGDVLVSESHPDVELVANDTGLLKVWAMPAESSSIVDRYLVSVDVGGRSDGADYSVITVLDRKESDVEKMEVVAQWRGHIDQDLLAWKAAGLAKAYHNALLIFESNTLETRNRQNGFDKEYILETIERYHSNIYYRSGGVRGFHTNVATKERLVANMIELVRDGGFIEHDEDAVNEYHYFEYKKNGGFGAIEGQHDDMVMSRGIALMIAKSMRRRRRDDAKVVLPVTVNVFRTDEKQGIQALLNA